MQLQVAHLSDVGQVRKQNEDSALYRGDPGGERGHLIVVADGMGGAAAGEIASRMAVDTVAEIYFGASGESAVTVLHRALAEANTRILQAASEQPDRHGMGTTCTALAVVDGRAYLAYVGDSRAYLLREHSFTRLTQDESVWADEVRDGGSPANEYGRNQLTRAVGIDADLGLQRVREIDLRSGDRLLLCSDGLWGLVIDPEIAVLAGSGDLTAACKRLVQLALARGAPDNVTVALAEVVDLAGSTRNP